MEKRPLEAKSRWTRITFVYYDFNNSPLSEQVDWISKSFDLCFGSKVGRDTVYSARGFLLFP